MKKIYETRLAILKAWRNPCEQSVTISPEIGLFRYRLGRLYLRQNRQDEALKELQAAADLGEAVGD